MFEYPKRIAWWHGTDALKLVMLPRVKWTYYLIVPLHRLFWRVMWRFFHLHYVHDKFKRRALVEFGIPEERIVVKHTGSTAVGFDKKDHAGFNVLFYLPYGKYQSWIYGEEYLNELVSKRPQYNFVRVDGTQNMSEVIPIIDAYIKINRTVYNGLGRLAEECEINNIPIIEVNAFRECFDNHIEYISTVLDKISRSD